MNRHSVILIADEGRGAFLRSLWDRMAERWPVHTGAPEASACALEGALSGWDFDAHVAMAMVTPDTSEVDVHRIVDMAEKGFVPLILLTDATDLRFVHLSSAGAITMPVGADAAVLAGMAHALLARQDAVDQLAGELGSVQRHQGGLRDEIERMHEELQLAATVQRELLPPRLPESPGLEFGVLFRPCGYVSGDIYGVTRLGPDHLGFFLADAVGHGVPAALMTVMLSRTLSQAESMLEAGSVVSPAEALGQLNEAMLRGSGPNHRFATGVYGVIDRRSREVTMATAGHPPPLLIGSDGKVDEVDTEGCLLGVFPDAVYEEVSFSLRGDDTLVIYSDGFETAFPGEKEREDNHARRLPTKRYLDAFSELAEARRSVGMSGAMDALAKQIDEQSGSLHQVDDLTALVLAGTEAAATGDEAGVTLVHAAG